MKFVFVPTRSYIFQTQEFDNKKNLSFNNLQLERWKWVAYSKEMDGAFYKHCIFLVTIVLVKNITKNSGHS